MGFDVSVKAASVLNKAIEGTAGAATGAATAAIAVVGAYILTDGRIGLSVALITQIVGALVGVAYVFYKSRMDGNRSEAHKNRPATA